MIKIATGIIGFFIPVIMILAGAMMKYAPPQDINHFYGYRTARSKKSKESWDYAHQYCGALWIKIGFVLTVITILLLLFINDINLITVFMLIQMVPMLASIYFVEKELKEKFGE